MACRNCDQNLFTFTVRLEPDNTILLDKSEDSPAMDGLWSRISKAVNGHSCADNPRVIELVEAAKAVKKYDDALRKMPVDLPIEGEGLGKLYDSMISKIRTALANLKSTGDSK